MLQEQVDAYLDHCRSQLSPRTVETRAYILAQLIHYLRLHQFQRWEECTIKVLRRYIMVRSQAVMEGGYRPLSASSLKTHLATLRLFFDYLVAEGYLPNNPARFLSPPKQRNHLPKTVEVELIERILNHPPGDELEVRDHAMCELFYSSGLRLSELAALNLESINMQRHEVRVDEGKGGRDRILPLGRAAEAALERWLVIRKRWLLAAAEGDQSRLQERALFISQRGGRLSSRQISQRSKRYAEIAGVNINMHPHLFRHSMATHLLESSQDILLVQKMLGHADVATTQIYTHLDFGHLSKVYDQAHPRAQGKGGEEEE